MIAQLIKRVQQLEASNFSSTATLAYTSNMASFSTLSPSTSWVIDSGASSHMTSKQELFSSNHNSSSSLEVMLANGSSTQVVGLGTVSLRPSLSLSSVLYVPQLPSNLLSVNQLTKTLSCSVTFYPSYCVFQDLQTKKMIGGGHERDGLYYLNGVSTADANGLAAVLLTSYYGILV